ncbi:MAG TPA: 23S rRNA (guanosine(2251)-2'-O)-methyltransferase RlmB [Rhodocyclaceae bacterium]|nr:MAG: 23S rRNA (guanosine(2251)-2'-O)-methyltransferase RlmB [Betaproteobacteria bacterium CG2_30_68_42]PJA57095.1 MAG: 23S rRNA (guanosine(2251)-2'-O)-methyltransferase RlmB [Rhodocyclales bacterium CG_4_9_14_3_um_filter_68_10]HCX32689.1 23S rRNA (guanosine(2251)-2'-O)-methyltransferase RlmB [Rhodocyclaceae bacterium]
MSETRFIHGFHAVGARVRRQPESVRELYLAGNRQDARVRDLARAAQLAGLRVVTVEAARLDAMVGHLRHQGVVARIDADFRPVGIGEVLDTLAEPALLLVLDGVQDPHNLGACLRVADAAGAHAVIAPRDRAVGLNATVIRVASGAADAVPYVTVTNLARTLRELKERGVWTLGAEAGAARDLYAADLRGPLAWVLGAEGSGLRRLSAQTCDELVRIPMHGTVESLNVSVAAGICLFEARRQRNSN